MRDREFEGNYEERDEHRDNLDYGSLDNDRDEESVLVSGPIKEGMPLILI